MPDIDPSIPVLNMADLDQRSRDDLIALAERDFDLDSVAGMPKPELIFRILEAQAERRGTIFSGGVLTLADDGFGFLRSQRMLPGPNDVYVSQSQVRRFGLRAGDYVTGRCASRRRPRSTTACSAWTR